MEVHLQYSYAWHLALWGLFNLFNLTIYSVRGELSHDELR